VTDTPLMTLRFTLPWPPSVNTYWRHIVLGGKFKKARAHTLISEAGRDYRVAVCAAVREQRVPREALKGRLAVYAIAFPPDRRARDLDNLWKGPLDALRQAKVIVDDENIDDLHIVRGAVTAGGRLELRVSEMYHEQRTLALPEPQAAANPF
jgi:crossover junction endodeoxyribonuclease RusA